MALTDPMRGPKYFLHRLLLVFPSICWFCSHPCRPGNYTLYKTFVIKSAHGIFKSLLKNWSFMAKYEILSTVQYKLSMVLFSRGLPHSFILVFEVHLQNILPSGCGEKTMPCEGQRECAAALAARRRVEKAFEACRSEEDESPGPAHCDIITTQLPLQHKEA